MHAFPHSPRHDPVLRSWLLRQHRDVLQEMAVRIAEEHRRGGHLGEDNRLIGWPAIEIERRNARGTERARGSPHICEAYRKGGMQRDRLRTCAGIPQSEHRVPLRTNPEECNLTRRLDVGRPKADDVTIERDRSFQIGHGQVDFEEVVNGNH
jgi:hypothetical protein